MNDDPIVNEVHQARQRIFAECKRDLECLIARLKSADLRNQERHVTFADVQKQNSTPKAHL